ncbi:hypothetical protein RFI_03831 [Reticulomyxa filosa]|uniref:Uncharacterized protein n=1 Tax=Reticulomyxa filosa TaxID=46433 RepID=X6P509_RETFI|nr:hypothetical protein RFI_03831 [Reticulomyxa filosa]|eukprot:ETO33276.1 hypothetical protein RFI_03831 [Reticulomyxa filosa]
MSPRYLNLNNLRVHHLCLLIVILIVVVIIAVCFTDFEVTSKWDLLQWKIPVGKLIMKQKCNKLQMISPNQGGEKSLLKIFYLECYHYEQVKNEWIDLMEPLKIMENNIKLAQGCRYGPEVESLNIHNFMKDLSKIWGKIRPGNKNRTKLLIKKKGTKKLWKVQMEEEMVWGIDYTDIIFTMLLHCGWIMALNLEIFIALINNIAKIYLQTICQIA